MLKNTGKQYDKHRENDHKQVCAIIQRQCESRQKYSLLRRTMWSAPWVMVLITARAMFAGALLGRSSLEVH